MFDAEALRLSLRSTNWRNTPLYIELVPQFAVKQSLETRRCQPVRNTRI